MIWRPKRGWRLCFRDLAGAAVLLGLIALLMTLPQTTLRTAFVLALFAVPLVAYSRAARATGRVREEAAIAHRCAGHLDIVLTASQRIQALSSREDRMASIAEAARLLTGCAMVAGFIPDVADATWLQRVAVIPTEAQAPTPASIPAPTMGVQELNARDLGRSLLVPLESTQERIVGAVWLFGLPDGMAPADDKALTTLITHAALAMQNAEVHERALALASEDSVTGLLNHRSLHLRLEEEVARARRGGHPLALLLIDLDDFSVINNTYGHQAGDAALVTVAARLRAGLRATDIAARYGGDEFAVILPETDMEAAVTVAAHVRAAIAAGAIAAGSATISVDTSVGVAALPLHARTREELVRAADRAAYTAKHAGKGRVSRPEDATLTLADDPAVLAAQLAHANLATVEALAAAVDAKDPYTRGHAQRVSLYAATVAQALEYSAAEVARVRLAGLLHDVGKIGVPDALLTKDGPLSEAEYAVVMQHPVIGERMLAGVPYLREILPAVRHHHERWDGEGYPDGLAGAAIPQDAAILAVVDSFDAMTSSRTYRTALPLYEARRRIRAESGARYDPCVVDAFEHALTTGAFTPAFASLNTTLLNPMRVARAS